MNALILGAGKVGLGIAKHLIEQGTNVIIVDNSQQVVNYVKHFAGLPIVLGDAFDTDYLVSLFQEAPTHIIATLSNDEQNLVACKIIGKAFPTSIKIARIRSQIFTQNETTELFVKNSFGIDTIIQPEIEVANAITNIVSIKNSLGIINLSNVVIVSIKCLQDTEILNTKMKLFESITDFLFRIIAISRNGMQFTPSHDDVLLPGDIAYIAMDKSQVDDILRLFGYPQEYKQNVLIVGGGNIGKTVAEKLLSQYPDISVTLIEKSREKANEIAQKYPKLMVMFGDVQNTKILQEASINIDTAVIATNDDKTNVLTSLFLKKNNVSRILTLSNNREYDQLLNSDLLNIIMDPNVVTVNNIVKQSRDINNFETSTLFGQSLCVIEIKITEICPNVGNSLTVLYEKNHIIPMFISRDGTLLKIKNDYKITIGDTIVIAVTNDNFNKVEAFFKGDFAENNAFKI